MKALLNKKLSSKKGFTLAELLIVVAIIAVLVAISIPIFTSQLEKAKEATDEANLRSAYAECSASCLSGVATDNTVTVTDVSGVVTATKDYTLTQSQDGWVDGEDKVIGGITLKSSDVAAGATYTITVKDDGSAPSIAKK